MKTVEMTRPTTPPEVTVTMEQAEATFSLLLSFQIGGLVQQGVSPINLANILMGKAASLMAAIREPQARENVVGDMLRSFRKAVHQRDIELRTTPGGILVPRPNGQE